jgi:hypothetical protein
MQVVGIGAVEWLNSVSPSAYSIMFIKRDKITVMVIKLSKLRTSWKVMKFK